MHRYLVTLNKLTNCLTGWTLGLTLEEVLYKPGLLL